MVAHEGFRRGKEVDIAVDAAHVEHVLAFQIRGVAPPYHLHADVVRSLTHIIRHVVFCVVVRAFGIAHIAAVHPYVGSAVHAVEMEEHALVGPALGQGEVAAVRGHGIDEPAVHRDGGRSVGEGVVVIYVERVAVTFHFQTRRHRYRIPVGHVGSIAPEVGLAGRLARRLDELKPPQTVQVQAVGAHGLRPRRFIEGVGRHGLTRGVGHVGGMARFAVFLENGLVLPIGRLGSGRSGHAAHRKVGGFVAGVLREDRHARHVGFQVMVLIFLVRAPQAVYAVLSLDGLERDVLVLVFLVGRPLQQIASVAVHRQVDGHPHMAVVELIGGHALQIVGLPYLAAAALDIILHVDGCVRVFAAQVREHLARRHAREDIVERGHGIVDFGLFAQVHQAELGRCAGQVAAQTQASVRLGRQGPAFVGFAEDAVRIVRTVHLLQRHELVFAGRGRPLQDASGLGRVEGHVHGHAVVGVHEHVDVLAGVGHVQERPFLPGRRLVHLGQRQILVFHVVGVAVGHGFPRFDVDEPVCRPVRRDHLGPQRRRRAHCHQQEQRPRGFAHLFSYIHTFYGLMFFSFRRASRMLRRRRPSASSGFG